MMQMVVEEVREGYKMTEIGGIPVDWEVTELQNIFKINTKSINPQSINVNIFHFSIPAFDKDKVPVLENSLSIKSNKTIIENDCILVSKLNPRINRTWKVIASEYKGIKASSTEFINYVPKIKVDLNYFYYVFSSKFLQEELMLRETGTTGSRKRVTPSSTLVIKVPLPQIGEQQKIAKILSTVDEQIENTKHLIEKTKDLKKGLMQQLLTKGIGNTEFKKTEMGIRPVNWELRMLGDIGYFYKGKGIAKKDVSEDGNLCILYGELYTKYTEVISHVFSKTLIEPSDSFLGKVNDVLIPSSGETAFDIATASSLLVDNILIGGDANIFRPSKDILGSFISYLINSVQKNDLAKLAQGSSVYHIYASSLNGFTIPVPPLEEQKKIVSILSSVNEQIESYEQEQGKYELLKQGLMQQLLTGQVRVKI